MTKKDKITYVNFKGKTKSVNIDDLAVDLMLPVKETKSLAYVLLSDVEIMCKNNNLDYNEFLQWMNGQTYPVVEEEGDNKFNCVYPWDVDRWTRWKIIHNQTPRVLD